MIPICRINNLWSYLMIKYSIIIPCYNVEQYINECLDSVLRQAYKDYELIVIDDCSTDRTYSILESYKSKFKNYTLIKQQHNSGVSVARNAGISVAKGKYVLFIDSDDFVTDDYLVTIDNCADDIELLSFGHNDYDKTTIKPSKMNVCIDMSDLFGWQKLLLKSFFASPVNKRYLLSIIKENDIAFEEGLVCYEDLTFNLEYCRYIENFVSIDKPLYFYRNHGKTTGKGKREWPNQFIISDYVYKSVKKFSDSKIIINDLYLYPYASYLIEITGIENKKNYKELVNKLIESNNFKHCVYHLKKKGKRIELLSWSLRHDIQPLSRLIIKSLSKIYIV